MMWFNCIRCKYMRKESGQCAAAGCFYTNVVADDCKRLNQLLDDAEQVVRCKDCKHYLHGEFYGQGMYCDIIDDGYAYKPDDFCSRGERKE